jgi:hypothetical protein
MTHRRIITFYSSIKSAYLQSLSLNYTNKQCQNAPDNILILHYDLMYLTSFWIPAFAGMTSFTVR